MLGRGYHILGQKFDSVPTKEEILNLIMGDDVGDKAKAREVLGNILTPMKDLLALFKFTEDLAGISARQAELLAEQNQAQADLDTIKVQIGDTESALKIQADKVKAAEQEAVVKIAKGQAEITKLEKVKADMEKKIEAAEKQKAALPQLIEAEYQQLRTKMLARLKSEEDGASSNLNILKSDLKVLKAEIAAAETILAQTKKGMAELAKGLTE